MYRFRLYCLYPENSLSLYLVLLSLKERISRNIELILRLFIQPVGAYNIVQSMQFITYRPAVVMIRTDGSCDIIRRKEGLEYVEAQEQLPETLIPEF